MLKAKTKVYATDLNNLYQIAKITKKYVVLSIKLHTL